MASWGAGPPTQNALIPTQNTIPAPLPLPTDRVPVYDPRPGGSYTPSNPPASNPRQGGGLSGSSHGQELPPSQPGNCQLAGRLTKTLAVHFASRILWPRRRQSEVGSLGNTGRVGVIDPPNHPQGGDFCSAQLNIILRAKEAHLHQFHDFVSDVAIVVKFNRRCS